MMRTVMMALPPFLLLSTCSSLASLLVVGDLPFARGFVQRDAPRQRRRVRPQYQLDDSSSTSSLWVGYSPPSSSSSTSSRVEDVADALQAMWRRQLQQSTSSSSSSLLLPPPRGRNETVGNPYVDQTIVSGGWTLRAPLSRLRQDLFEEEATTVATASRQFQLFVDLDGVLCDFEHGVRSIFPEMTESMSLQDLERHDMWKRISSQSSFFRSLPWAKGGPELWDAVRHLQPDILTGVPASFAASRVEKFDWCARELFGLDDDASDVVDSKERRIRTMRKGLRHQCGMVEHVDMAGQFFQHARVNENPAFLKPLRFRKHSRRHVSVVRRQRVITCWSSNKHHESRPGAVLIDDCLRLRDDWERKGGIFIHHKTGDVDRTLQQLVDHGIINEPR